MPKCNCYLLITCLFVNCTWNVSFNYFYQESRGVKVPEVKIIDFGPNFNISLNVKLGVKHIKLN